MQSLKSDVRVNCIRNYPKMNIFQIPKKTTTVRIFFSLELNIQLVAYKEWDCKLDLKGQTGYVR